MILEKASLFNLRNYDREEFEFKENLNFILGDNAQGKTNLLEAIYYACIGRAFRTTRSRDFMKQGTGTFGLTLEFVEGQRRFHFRMEGDKKNRRVTINHLCLPRRSDLFGHFPMVLFAPDHLQMIKEGPSHRRAFFDREISLLSRSYFYELVRYNKVLLERGALLKEEHPDMSLLDVYDEQLVRYGQPVFEKRQNFVKKLEETASVIHREFSVGREELKLTYESSLLKEASFREQLLGARSRDMKLRQSSVGIHLDDLSVVIGNVDVRRFGSQGQIRLSALSIFLGLIPFIEEELGKKPIILLDDVFSELDRVRRENILKRLEQYQCLITSTDLDGFRHDAIKEAHIQWIEAGQRRRNT